MKYITLSLMFLAFAWTTQASAKVCKGKSITSCKTSTTCSWVKSYQKKDRTKVSGFCRKAGKKHASKTKSKSKKISKKSKSKKIAKNIKSKKKTTKSKTKKVKKKSSRKSK